MIIRPFDLADENDVVALWRACNLVVPWNDPHRDIARKMAEQPELFFVGEIEGRVVATLMAGYEGHRGWLNYLAVAPDVQQRGLGRKMVQYALEKLEARGCAKVNLQVRASNAAVIAFYERIGFTSEATLSMGKRLINDE